MCLHVPATHSQEFKGFCQTWVVSLLVTASRPLVIAACAVGAVGCVVRAWPCFVLSGADVPDHDGSIRSHAIHGV